MKKLLVLFLFTTVAFAQQKIRFEYDAAGNQISRTLCLTCNARLDKTPKQMEEVKTEDLEKFFEEDVISYYPNPVKQELYLKWDLIQNNKVNTIQIFNMNGQVLSTYNNLNSLDNHILNFGEYPAGIYFIQMNLVSGEEKSIKIIKQ